LGSRVDDRRCWGTSPKAGGLAGVLPEGIACHGREGEGIGDLLGRTILRQRGGERDETAAGRYERIS
jgi:hypothetical protein